jgi:transcriptional regulator with XRE-family HTH domain
MRLRKLRREREWTLADVGKRVGLDAPMICLIEQRKRRPSLEKAFALAHVFGVSIEELFADVDIPA